MLNIDLEEEKSICKSAAGFYQGSWEGQFEHCTNGILENTFSLTISGFQGGHSAKYINDKNRLNSIIEGFNILKNVGNYQHSSDFHIQLISASEKPLLDDDEDNWKINTNAIPNYLTVTFATDLDEDTIEEIVDDYVEHNIKPKETKAKWELSVFDFPKKPEINYVLSQVDTKELCNRICNLENGCGTDDEDFLEDGTPVWSKNISGIRIYDIRDDSRIEYSDNPCFVHIDVMGRSCDIDNLGEKDPTKSDPSQWDGFAKYYYDWWEDSSDDTKNTYTKWTPNSYQLPWFHNNEELDNIIKGVGSQLGYTIKEFNEHSWLELSALTVQSQHSSPNISISAIGPNVIEPHSCREMVETDSIDSVIKILIKKFQKIK